MASVIPRSYHGRMAVRKKTLSFDEDLWAAVERRAREAETRAVLEFVEQRVLADAQRESADDAPSGDGGGSKA